jgi:NADP-dependent aldehyde dehydrogenase
LGGEPVLGGGRRFAAVDPRNGEALAPDFAEATGDQVDRALALAEEARRPLRELPRETRARFLERVAEGLDAVGEALTTRAAAETALPEARLTAERGRTMGQLRLFARVVREGSYLGLRIDHGDPDRQPTPRPDLRRKLVPVGPVVVFGASNFPLAFSVAGGDTASALAAGCPVVVKAHPHHPGTAELAGEVIATAVRELRLPTGTFSLLHGAGHEVGLALVRHRLTRAVAFTGSQRGGRALFAAAAARPEPVPVYAEMGSTNPLFLLPAALARRGAAIAADLVASVTLGVGQFCTNPGLVFVPRGAAGDRFRDQLATLFRDLETGTLLHAGIRRAYDRAVDEAAAVAGVEVVARGRVGEGPCAGRPALLAVPGAVFRGHPELAEEIFGPATVLVTGDGEAELLDLAAGLPGQLTAGVHADPEDRELARALLQVLEDKAGRLLWNGFPTGVEVSPAMQHGGPYPATTDPRATSVGTAAIERFLRPVAYQGFPPELLPAELAEGRGGIWRWVDGDLERG